MYLGVRNLDKRKEWYKSVLIPEENGVGEAVEPAVDNQELHGDLEAAEKLHLRCRIFLRGQADIEQAASWEGCVESCI